MYIDNHTPPAQEELAVRIAETNPNHHIWNNNGTWWIHYTAYPTPVTAERRRESLRTKDEGLARANRSEAMARRPTWTKLAPRPWVAY